MKSYNTYLLIVITFFISSCSDEFLDREPLDQLVSTNFYQTEEDAKKGISSYI